MNVFKKDVTDCESKKKLAPNVLTIYIQPTEGFSLSLNGKEIGQGFDTLPVKLDYRNSTEIVENTPEAYEKLLLDALNGTAPTLLIGTKLLNHGASSMSSDMLGIKKHLIFRTIQQGPWDQKPPMIY